LVELCRDFIHGQTKTWIVRRTKLLLAFLTDESEMPVRMLNQKHTTSCRQRIFQRTVTNLSTDLERFAA
jgi:hypothetical protein